MNSDARPTAHLPRMWLDESGIVHVLWPPQSDVGLPEAKASMRAVADLSGGVRRRAVIDMSEIRSIDRDARLFFAGEETARVQSAVALVVRSPIARAIGNFFMGMNRSRIPARLFPSEAEAIAWLGMSFDSEA